MIWFDGGWLDTARGILWVVANLAIAYCYTNVIGRKILAEHSGLSRHLWGLFIYACGFGHVTMVAYMAINPTEWMFTVVTIVDSFTAWVTIRAAYKAPELPV